MQEGSLARKLRYVKAIGESRNFYYKVTIVSFIKTLQTL